MGDIMSCINSVWRLEGRRVIVSILILFLLNGSFEGIWGWMGWGGMGLSRGEVQTNRFVTEAESVRGPEEEGLFDAVPPEGETPELVCPFEPVPAVFSTSSSV